MIQKYFIDFFSAKFIVIQINNGLSLRASIKIILLISGEK